jgi:hypothetical protein
MSTTIASGSENCQERFNFLQKMQKSKVLSKLFIFYKTVNLNLNETQKTSFLAQTQIKSNNQIKFF